MISLLFKGILMGLIIGVPVGAVGALCISRTLQYGPRSGFVTGIGCSVADCIYASVGAFGLRAVSDFLGAHERIITLIGALLVMVIGVTTILKKDTGVRKVTAHPSFGKMFVTSFGIGITNPSVVILFMVIFANFGITGKLAVHESIFLLAGFFIGTVTWWFILIGGILLIEYKFGSGITRNSNKVLGAVMVILGIVLLIKLIRRI